MNGGLARNAMIVVGVLALVCTVAIVRRGSVARDAGVSGMADRAAASASSAPVRLPRLVDLGADRCIPCKEMAPILAALRTEYAGRATIEFIDVWKRPEEAETYDVRVIPTQIFYARDGAEAWRHEGFLSRAEIVAKLKELGAG